MGRADVREGRQSGEEWVLSDDPQWSPPLPRRVGPVSLLVAPGPPSPNASVLSRAACAFLPFSLQGAEAKLVDESSSFPWDSGWVEGDISAGGRSRPSPCRPKKRPLTIVFLQGLDERPGSISPSFWSSVDSSSPWKCRGLVVGGRAGVAITSWAWWRPAMCLALGPWRRPISRREAPGVFVRSPRLSLLPGRAAALPAV